jgi:uncharacterized protein (DUF736 family)
MAIIGTFTPTKDGGWSGTIRTLTIDVKARFVPNDNKDSDRAPDFRIFARGSEVGAAWLDRATGAKPREYLRVQLDDPSLAEPFYGALFEHADAQAAQLVWTRRRRSDRGEPSS